MTRDIWFTVGDIFRARNTFNRSCVIERNFANLRWANLPRMQWSLVSILQPNSLTDVWLEACIKEKRTHSFDRKTTTPVCDTTSTSDPPHSEIHHDVSSSCTNGGGGGSWTSLRPISSGSFGSGQSASSWLQIKMNIKNN